MNTWLHLEEVTSTNDYIKEHVQDLDDRSVVTADVQTAGKGRLGRSWVSLADNVYMSVLFKNPTRDVALFPLLCGLAVLHALEDATNASFQIKWPNDVVFQSKKICGILCESMISSSQSYIICGMGINVNLTEADFEESLLPYATSLSREFEEQFDTKELARAIANHLFQIVSIFQQFGFSKLKEQYEEYLVSLNQEVQVIYQQKTVQAICLGIADNGNLLCRTEDGSTFFVHSGEASVRGLYGYL